MSPPAPVFKIVEILTVKGPTMPDTQKRYTAEELAAIVRETIPISELMPFLEKITEGTGVSFVDLSFLPDFEPPEIKAEEKSAD